MNFRLALVLILGLHTFSSVNYAEGLRQQLGHASDGLAEAPLPTATVRPELPLTNLIADLETFFRNPNGFLKDHGNKLFEAVKAGNPGLVEEVERLMKDYERLQDDMRKFQNENLRGKTADQISKETLDEMRRRSKELRDLETTIRRKFNGDDIKALIERFRKNPREFVEKEGDLLVQRLKEHNPEQAKDVDSLISKSKNQLKGAEKQLSDAVKNSGVEGFLKNLRKDVETQLDSVKKLEGQINDILRDVEKDISKSEEIERLRRKLNESK